MPKPPFLKLVIAGTVCLTIAGVGYAGFEMRRDRVQGESQRTQLVSEEERVVGKEADPAVETSPLEDTRWLWSQDEVPDLDVSAWQTYHNEEFGFQVKYPPELFGLERIYSSTSFGRGGINFILPELGPIDPFHPEPYMFSGRTFWLTDIGITPDTCQPNYSTRDLESIQIQKEIGGITFTRSEFKRTVAQLGGIEYIGGHQGICYRLSYRTKREDWKELEGNIARFEEIVSTFELLREILSGQGSY